MWEIVQEKLDTYKDSWFYDGKTRISYCEVKKYAERVGQNLRDMLRIKSKCAVLCDSEMMTALGILSCWYAQLIPVPMSMNYGEKHCMSIIETSNLKYLITDKESYSEKFGLYTYNIENSVWYGERVGQAEEHELDDIDIIMNTSGTTGKPKGVMITNSGLYQNIINISHYFKIKENDTILIARPLYHCAVLTGEFLISLYNGLNICFYIGTYNPMAIIHYMNCWNISVMCGTPTLFLQISNYFARQKQYAQLRVIALSGEVLTSQIAEKIRSVFKQTEIYNVYGLTEASPRVSYLDPALFDKYAESVGIPLVNTKITIRDNEGNEVIAGVDGNIFVESTCLMRGYYRNKRLSEEKLTKYGLKTGDIGYVDKDGRLYIRSRADDMIIKAGMNIYPSEIENSICNFPFILETVAYGKRDDMGQKIAVNIVLKDGYKEMTKRDIMSAFSESLPTHLMPSWLEIVDKLPRNGSGKIIRPRE